MATRFYLQPSAAGIPGISPAFDGGWEQTASGTRRWLKNKPLLAVISPSTTLQPNVPITTTQDILANQWISDPIPGQIISGTFSLVIRVIQSVTTCNATLAVVVKIVSNDGATSRGTLFSVFGTDTAYATGTAATRIVNAQTVTNQTAQDGDRIVVEVGAHVAAPSTSGNYTNNYGTDAATDYALTTALTTTLNPWCEFSQNLFPDMPQNYQSIEVGDGMSASERIR